MLENVIAVILAGGQGSRLWPLTEKRAKPAVPIAGKFRLIDISFSNCLHSDVRKIFVLTQFASKSLHRHISATYPFPQWSRGFVQILAAQQTMESKTWYQGTADAVRQNLEFLVQKGIDHYLILSGDHLYRMDYRDMLKTHTESKADVTVSVIPVAREKAHHFGILKTDEHGQISDFHEKPDSLDILDEYKPNQDWLRNNCLTDKEDCVLASMGIYIFSRKALFVMLDQTNESDFGKGIFPKAIKQFKVVAHCFNDYWEDIGTIKAFYESMIALTEQKPRFDFYNDRIPVFTHARFLPGARIHGCNIAESIICDAARMQNATIHKSIIGIRSMVREGAKLDRVVLMGADFAETETEKADCVNTGKPLVGIGEGSIIEKAIIDKNARIGKNVRMLVEGRPQEIDEKNYAIRDGILIVPKNAVIPDGSIV
ncbi:MAG: glucose-1-phosphate adenylyltransferase [bacterium]